MHTDTTVHLQLENSVQAIAPALDDIAAVLGRHGADEQVVFQLRLALDELLTNSVMHGFPDGGRHTIGIAVQIRPPRVQVTLSDDGVAFDPFQAASPDIDAPAGDRPIGGLGIHLVKQLIPDLRYNRVGARNVIELASPLRQATPVASEP